MIHVINWLCTKLFIEVIRCLPYSFGKMQPYLMCLCALLIAKLCMDGILFCHS